MEFSGNGALPPAVSITLLVHVGNCISIDKYGNDDGFVLSVHTKECNYSITAHFRILETLIER